MGKCESRQNWTCSCILEKDPLQSDIFLLGLCSPQAQREKNLPTVPSTIGQELTYNPFMRVKLVIVCYWLSRVGLNGGLKAHYQSTNGHVVLLPTHPHMCMDTPTPTHTHRVPSVQQHAKSSDPITTIGFLREEKNNFKRKLWQLSYVQFVDCMLFLWTIYLNHETHFVYKKIKQKKHTTSN